MKEQTCCFTGHRFLPASLRDPLFQHLVATVRQLAAEGYCRFLSGGAMGFDTLAALAVLEVKKTLPHLHLVLALPCLNHTKNWKPKELALFETVKQGAEEVRILSGEYQQGCTFARNRYMVDQSSVCVAYLTKASGGTFYTVNYARKQGLRVLLYQGGACEAF